MAITVDTLKFFKSERMTDYINGGGKMTANEILLSEKNAIFDDVSDVDRAAGDVSVRKVFAAVTSSDTDKYLDAGVAICKAPEDISVGVLLTSTGNHYDTRADIQAYIENYLVPGPSGAWNVYGKQMVGSLVVSVFCRPSDAPPKISTTLLLTQYTSTTQQTVAYQQYIRITRIISNDTQVFIDSEGKEFTRRVILLEISEPLRDTYDGIAITRADGVKGIAGLNICLIAQGAKYSGIRPLAAAAALGALTAQVDSIYSRIVPTAQSEIILADRPPASNADVIVPAGDVFSFATALLLTANTTLRTYTAFIPQSLSISVSGGTLTDDGGKLKAGGNVIGTVDYANGLVRFGANSPTYSGSKTVSFTPGSLISQTADSAAIYVAEESRLLSYVKTLAPKPAPGTLVVSYLSLGGWYDLRDAGNGILAGVSENYGNGSIDYSTGTVSLTLGALPDIGSAIIFSWGSSGNIAPRAVLDARDIKPEIVVENAVLRDLYAGTDRSLTVGGTAYAFDEYGGGAVGSFHYADFDRIILFPPTLLAAGTPIEISWTTRATYENRTGEITPDSINDGVVSLIIPAADYVAGTLMISAVVPAVANKNVSSTQPRSIAIDLADLKDWDGITDGLTDRGGWQNTNPIAMIIGSGEISISIPASSSRTINETVWVPGEVQTYKQELQEISSGNWQWVTVATTVAAEVLAFDDVENTAVIGAETKFYYRYCAQTDIGGDACTATLVTPPMIGFPTVDESPINRGGQIAPGLLYGVGAERFYEQGGNLYRMGDDAQVGSINSGTGYITLTSWGVGASKLTVYAQNSYETSVRRSWLVFRTAAAPIAVGSFQGHVTIDNGETLTFSADARGEITGSKASRVCRGRIDYQTGVVSMDFWNTQPYVSPCPVLIGSMRYNAVSYTNLPLDSSLIGLDPVRLPSDGRVPIFRNGQLVLVHNTRTKTAASLSPTQEINCEQVRLYRVMIADQEKRRLPSSFYSVNRELGVITMAADLDLSEFEAPYSIHYTIADMAVIKDADLSGRLALTKALSHNYPKDNSWVSGIHYIGTMQARYTNLFAQAAWTSVWSSTRIGDAPLAQYNDVAYPLTLTNEGAYPDRYLVRFTSSILFQVVGENQGIIGGGNITEDCEPINSLTGQPLLKIDCRGWGSGWATGNCLRFDVVAANYPIDLIRAIQPSQPHEGMDGVELLFLGNVEAA